MTLLTGLAVALWLAGYTLLCAVRPFGDCRKCHGTGLRDLAKAAKVCRRCRGQRIRLRAGRRAYNTWLRTRDAGTRTHASASAFPRKEN